MTLTKKVFVAWLREQKPERRFQLGTGNEPLLQWATETSKVYPRMGWSWPSWAQCFLHAQDCWECDRMLVEKVRAWKGEPDA